MENNNCSNSPTSHLVVKKRKAMIAVLLGTVIERYDYALYGCMSAILSSHIFPNDDPSVALIKHFLVFAIGFLAKPLGAYIFGCIGDGKGRKCALRWNIVGIAIPTVMIGCLPSYAQIGAASIWLLCFCRMAQGMFISAEADGVDIFIYESISKRYACFANSFTWMFSSLGCSMASFIAGKALLPHLPIWAWRLPFLFGGVLGLITLWFRKYLTESYDYSIYAAHYSKGTDNSFANYWKILCQNKLNLFYVVIIQGSQGGSYAFYSFFWNNYLHKVHNILSAAEVCSKALIFVLTSTIAAPICGYLADRIGIFRSIRIGAVLCIAITVVNGIAMHQFHNVFNSLIILTAIVLMFFSIPVGILLMKLFTVGTRYRCMSMGHALAAMIFSSSTPAIATLFWQKFQLPIAPLFYCGFLLVMGLVISFFIKDKPTINDMELPFERENLERPSNLINCPVFCCKKN